MLRETIIYRLLLTNATLLFILEEREVFAVKRLLCLLLCALCLCACGVTEEAPLPTEEPAEMAVYETVTWADIEAIPIANDQMTEEELRQICVDFFRLQLSFQWTPKENFTYQIVTYEKPNLFSSGTVYAGCPYLSPSPFGNLYVVMDYYDSETGILDNTTMSNQEFAERIGNECCTSPAWAWTRVVSSVVDFNNNFLTPFYGFPTVGDYICSPTRWADGSNTVAVCEENGEAVIYEAYAQCKPADLLLHHYGEAKNSHVRMVAAEPVVVRREDGSIDPDESYLVQLHQTSTASEQTVAGYQVIAQGGIDEISTFRELYKESYLPFTFPEFTGELPVAPVELRLSFGERESITLQDLRTGMIRCNYFISHAIVTLADEKGNTVLEKSYYPVSGIDARRRLYTAKIAEDPQVQALLEDQDLTMTIACRVSTGQLLTAWTGSFIKS